MMEARKGVFALLFSFSMSGLLALAGCTPPSDEEETTEETSIEETPFEILGVFPPDNAMAVPKDVEIKVTFSKEYEGDFSLFNILLESDDDYEVPIDVALDEDLTKVTVTLLEELADDTDYFITIDFDSDDNLDWESDFTTLFPDGITFDVSIDFTIEQLGANEELIDFINSNLDPEDVPPILMIAVDYFAPDPFPWDDFIMAGGIDEDQDDGIYSVDPEYGLPIAVIGCSVDEVGILSSPPQEFIIPLNIDPVEATLYISETTLSGTMYRDEVDLVAGVVDYTISGLILEEDIEKIAAETEYGILLEDLLEPDTDTDGDGVLDGVSVVITSQPVVVELTRPEENGGE